MAADIPDFIPDDQFVPDVQDSEAMPQTSVVAPIVTTNPDEALANIQKQQSAPDFIPDHEFVSDEEKYGGLGQQAITGLEGAAEGLAGPLAPLVERGLGVDPKAIRGRRAENPVAHGVGEAAGLTAGLLTGTGEAAVMTKAGEAATTAVGLGAKGASYGHRVGAAIVREAAEAAVMQGSDEISKVILKDPEASAESAIANMGLATALGGAGGGLFAGAVSPLWKATAGSGVDKTLNTIRKRLDGNAIVLPEAVDSAVKNLGVEVDPALRAAMGGGETAENFYNTLQYAQNPKIQDMVEGFEAGLSEKVAQKLGIDLEAAKVYDKADAGHALEETFKKEFKQKYEPLEAAFTERNKLAETISVPDEARLELYGRMLEDGIQKVGTDSPAYKLYNEWGNRILAKDTVGGLDKLRTEIGNDIERAVRTADYNTANSLRDIRTAIGDFQESQISKQSRMLESEGAEFGEAIGRDILNERAEASQQYKEFAQLSNELLDHIGSGRFSGAGGLLKKIEAAGPETLLKKFSAKGNADIIPFLQKHFPETLEAVRQQELKDLLKPAITNVKGEMPINFEKLAKILDSKDAGQSRLLEFALPEGSREAIDAAKTLMDALPKRRDSGTPGGLAKLMRNVPASALSMVAMLTGNNPVVAHIIGEISQRLGRDVPDAVRLGYLKFLGSEQPIKAEGFKAMIDYFEQTIKGQKLLGKASTAIFKPGMQVLGKELLPDVKDREKLDKVVTRMQEAPDRMTGLGTSDVGYYLPEHQGAVAQAATTATQYLQQIKPQPVQLSPLDRPIEPSAAEKARYDRALDIAQQPMVVFQHIKDGTLLPSDIQDLTAMYPALYKSMVDRLSLDMQKAVADGETVPYKTRMSVSLFMGQPLDSTMSPTAIQAAQRSMLPQQPQQPAAGPKPQGKSLKSLGKNNKSYQTSLQAAEAEDADRS